MADAMNEEAKVGRVTKSLCCTTIFEPCTSSVFAVSAFCQLIYSYQWLGDRAVGSRRNVAKPAEGKLVICMTPACCCVYGCYLHSELRPSGEERPVTR